jgi:hypothetical protein
METAPRKMSNDDNVSFLTVVGCCLLFTLAIYGFYRLYVDVDSFADLIVYSDRLLPYLLYILLLVFIFLAELLRASRWRWRNGFWTRDKNKLMPPKKPLGRMIFWMAMIIVVVCMFACEKTNRHTLGNVTWRYTVSDGEATIGRMRQRDYAAISVSTVGELAVPLSLGGYPVTGIGDYAFYKCGRLTSVAIPDGVKWIGIDAFSDCKGLTSVVLPEGVKIIGYKAFAGCDNLKDVSIPASVTEIGYGAFPCCGLEKVHVHQGDAKRVKEMLRGKGVDVDKVEFVEREEAQAAPALSSPSNSQAQ